MPSEAVIALPGMVRSTMKTTTVTPSRVISAPPTRAANHRQLSISVGPSGRRGERSELSVRAGGESADPGADQVVVVRAEHPYPRRFGQQLLLEILVDRLAFAVVTGRISRVEQLRQLCRVQPGRLRQTAAGGVIAPVHEVRVV